MSIAPPEPGAPGPPPVPPRQRAPGATTALVCGILGVALPCGGLVLGIIALFSQRKAKALINQYPGLYEGDGFCTAGLVLGILGVIFGALQILWFVSWSALMGLLFGTLMRESVIEFGPPFHP